MNSSSRWDLSRRTRRGNAAISNAGNFEYNRTLSQRRAESVVATLVRDYKVDKSRLLPVGVSFAAPVASNQSEEGRAQNRRVELVQY